MMPRPRLLALAALTLAVPALAQSAPNPAATRIAGYRALGSAFKAVNDGLRAGNLAAVPASGVAISNAARAQYRWYAANTRPGPGVRTHARPEIWTRAAEFRAAQDRFALQAAAFRQASTSGNADTIRAASRQLGAACRGCHDTFRVEDD